MRSLVLFSGVGFTGLSLATILCLMTAPASADILWNNGPINGTLTGYGINLGSQVADSFLLLSDSTLTGANFGVWAFPGDVPSTVDWSIWNGGGPGGGGSKIDFGTGASLTNLDDGLSAFGFQLWTSSFSMPSIALGAGTYWLELENATLGNGAHDFLFWDQNNGPSQAWLSGEGFLTAATNCAHLGNGPPSGFCSQPFEILGTTGQSAVPEPSGLAVCGSGLLLAGVLRRKLGRLAPTACRR
jgi:hypothetical protein